MDVHIGQLRSTVRAVDETALLSSAVLDRIVRVVLARLAEQEASGRRADADRQLRNGVSAAPHWTEGTR